jgi:hypothetical protein
MQWNVQLHAYILYKNGSKTFAVGTPKLQKYVDPHEKERFGK